MTYRLLRGGAALLARQRPTALQQSRCRSGPGGKGGKTTSTALEDTKAKKAQAEALAKRGGVLTAEEEDCGTPELPRYFKDPDREKRMISAKGTSAMAGRREANYTKGRTNCRQHKEALTYIQIRAGEGAWRRF